MASLTDKAMAKIFKALGDETRLEIVRMLVGKERCVCAFLNAFSMTQPAISNHLRVLREAGVVIDSRDGRWIFYRLNPEHSKPFNSFVKIFCWTRWPSGSIP